MNDDDVFDVVVIGSGFGGAAVAHRLASRDRSVLVLERGQPYPPGSFPRTPRQLRRAFWDPANDLHGLFDLWSFKKLDVVCASGLGGGSLIYANVMIRKDEWDGWPLAPGALDEHYTRVWHMQQPRRYPFDSPKTTALKAAADRLELEFERPPLAVRFDGGDGPSASVHGRRTHRRACLRCGECVLGCNHGAKNTLDYTFLTAAQRAGAQLRTSCEAVTIQPHDGGYRVGYRQHLVQDRERHPAALRDPNPARSRTVTARKALVLAAGAIGSTRLLLTNRASLPGLSPALGTRVSANGDAIGWVRDADRYLDPSDGPTITGSVRVRGDGASYRVQDAGAPPLGDWLWEALEAYKLPWRLRRRIAKRLFGRRDPRLGADLAAAIGDRSARLLPLLGMGLDVPDGRFVLDGDRLALDWSSKPSKRHYKEVERGFADIARALGGRPLRSPAAYLSRTVTVHPLGGCPMAEDPRRGVVATNGAVHGHRGLYVADGAVMPAAVGPNPSFTIAAFADRVAEGIAHV